ncbi:anti-sigma factor domain-containing protein [Geobacillus zalihae]|uniref:anti-sigma factor domain-containing protein n=1 Tax=Geobacillus zalihae TaxID=213419 RepID=UPI001680FBC1|nr:anti-sigma factor domain-containing protein [Geobacillus zalihae]QNU24398.1 anti-sigma factor domain-containing protein [Geobacillus zalihae]
MKKGIVLELDEEFVTVLTPEGEFLRLKKEKEWEVGEEIEASAVKKLLPFHRRSFRYALVSALAAAVLLVTTWIQWPSDAVYAYMSIDINPSMEAGVDAELRVLTLKAYNEEGKKVLTALPSWKRQPFSSVAKQIIALSEQKGYLKKGGEVLITTVERERDASSARKLSAALADIQRSVADNRIVITTANSTMAVRNQAVKRGMTTGKLLQIEKKVKPASSTSTKPDKGNGQVGKSEKKASPSKGRKLEQPAQVKQKHREQKTKQQKKEKQMPHERKNPGLNKESSPSGREIPPKKGESWKRPSIAVGGHYATKKTADDDRNNKKDRRQADVHRHLKAMNSKTKKAE